LRHTDLAILLNFLVNFLLLLGTNRLLGHPTSWWAAVFAAAIGGLYARMCLVPEFFFLGSMLWKMVSIVVIAGIAYGFTKDGIRKGGVFALLTLALDGIATGFGDDYSVSLLAGSGIVVLLCTIGFRGCGRDTRYVPVELHYNGKILQLNALYDTGNSLRDPVTGRPVLVISADAAQQLTGLSNFQLQNPVVSLPLAGIPGLRLIPYKTVGQPCGMLLALRLQRVKIGQWEGSSLVAFAPERLSHEGKYQALTGGTL